MTLLVNNKNIMFLLHLLHSHLHSSPLLFLNHSSKGSPSFHHLREEWKWCHILLGDIYHVLGWHLHPPGRVLLLLGANVLHTLISVNIFSLEITNIPFTIIIITITTYSMNPCILYPSQVRSYTWIRGSRIPLCLMIIYNYTPQYMEDLI